MEKETYIVLRREMQPKDRIVVAMDVNNPEKAMRFVELLSPYVGAFKFGLEFEHAMRSNLLTLPLEKAFELLRVYRNLNQLVGRSSFEDAKLCDIPNTVEGASFCISSLGVKMFNLHCLGGPKMMEAAVKAASGFQKERPLVIGVTVLTSLSFDDFSRMGINLIDPSRIATEDMKRAALKGLVRNLALLAKECGLDGVVCSPQEAAAIREACGPDFLEVTPAIRSKTAPPDDQKRTMTPAEAIGEGADMLVIGRPITGAKDPVEAAKRFADEIALGLKEAGR